MNRKTVALSFAINDNDCPNIDALERSYASASFHAAGPEYSRDQITIEANRSGLLALATWMVALADSDSKLDHQHFDNEVGMGFFQSEGNVELIIQRVGK